MRSSSRSAARALCIAGLLAALAPSGCGDDGYDPSWSCDGALEFADARFGQAIRDAIGKPDGDLVAEDVAGLTYLEASSRQIGDLGGAQCLTALTELYLGDNQITDLGPLEPLAALEDLVLEVNGIADLGPLAGLTGLATLSLHSNQVWDLSPLVANEGLGDGDVVWLADNPIDMSDQAANIQALEDRGVTLLFD